jgi:uncharacterized protein (TIGR03435 family)
MAPEKHTGKHWQALILILAAGCPQGPAWGQSDAPSAVRQARPQATAAGAASAQSGGAPSGPVEFEVVSIKASPPGDGRGFYGCRGGPGSSDPGQITCNHGTAGSLVPSAYEVDFARVSYEKLAAPDRQEFAIVAKVPHGATKEQVRQMWQNLLKNRFKLAVHRETREVPVYELVVAKGGFKAKEWVEPPGSDPEVAPWEPGSGRPKLGNDGFPLVAPGRSMSFFTSDSTGDKARYVAPAGTIKDLATMLEGRLNLNRLPPRPVIDATELDGKYDLKFWWSPVADTKDDAEGPDMLSALESQLGLKLQPKKSAPVEFLVVDRLEAPAEN